MIDRMGSGMNIKGRKRWMREAQLVSFPSFEVEYDSVVRVDGTL